MTEKTAQTYLNPDQAAEYLGVTTRSLRRDVAAGRLIAYKYGNRSVRYSKRDLDNLIRPASRDAE